MPEVFISNRNKKNKQFGIYKRQKQRAALSRGEQDLAKGSLLLAVRIKASKDTAPQA